MVGAACYHPGCNQPVIGMCNDCNRCYCRSHSVDTRCRVCWDKETEQLALQALVEDYVQTAEQVRRKQGIARQPHLKFFLLIIVLPIVVFFSGLMVGQIFIRWNLSIIGAIINVLSFLVAGGLFLTSSWWVVDRHENQVVAQIESQKPGFKKFYAMYKEQKGAEAFAKGMDFLLKAGVGAASFVKYAHDDLQASERRIEAQQRQRKIDDAIDKLK